MSARVCMYVYYQIRFAEFICQSNIEIYARQSKVQKTRML